MKIAIIGGGALGSLFAAAFARARHRNPAFHNDHIMLLGASDTLRPHMAAIAEHGLTVVPQFGDNDALPETFAPSDIQVASIFSGSVYEKFAPVDAVIVLVKSYQTVMVAPFVARLLGLPATAAPDSPGGAVLTLQNGLGNAETLEETCGWEHVAPGTTRYGGYLRDEQPGTVWHAANGELLVGLPHFAYGAGDGQLVQFRPRPAGVRAAIDGVVARLVAADVPAALETSPRKIETALWRKLAINCAVNPLTALLDVPNGEIAEIADAWLIATAAAHEVAAVAVARGLPRIIFHPDQMDALLSALAANSHANISSMLQDVRNRRPTEIEAINGALVLAAEDHNVRAPTNQFLAQMLRAKQAAYLPPQP